MPTCTENKRAGFLPRTRLRFPVKPCGRCARADAPKANCAAIPAEGSDLPRRAGRAPNHRACSLPFSALTPLLSQQTCFGSGKVPLPLPSPIATSRFQDCQTAHPNTRPVERAFLLPRHIRPRCEGDYLTAKRTSFKTGYSRMVVKNSPVALSSNFTCAKLILTPSTIASRKLPSV